MTSSVVTLSPFAPARTVSVREINGFDEMLVEDCSTRSAVRFLNGVMVATLKENVVVSAEKLPVADRDLMLAVVFQNTYGNKIESSVRCGSCGNPYDVNFSLGDYVSDKRKALMNCDVHNDGSGFFSVRDKFRFRLPTGEDELAVLGLSAKEADDLLFSRCTQGYSANDLLELMKVMEDAGPILMDEFPIQCPECGCIQRVHFDIQTYLLTRITNERTKLIVDIHRIALSYGWNKEEILSLSRRERQMFSNLIAGN